MMTLKITHENWEKIKKNTIYKYGIEGYKFMVNELNKKMSIEIVG